MAKAVRATINDVAKAAKIGKISISRYLSGEKYLFLDDLSSHTEEAIAGLDYRPSLTVHGFKHGRTRLIGLVIANITNPYSVSVMSSIRTVCREKGFILLMCNINSELDQGLRYLDLLRSYRAEGIAINTVGMQEDGLDRLQQSALPMVPIDRKIPDFACDAVGPNNTQAATTATEYLMEKEFRAILFPNEPLGSVNIRRERLSVFHAILTCHHGVVAENAEVQLNNGAMIDNVLCQFHTRHRRIRKAVIPANGALMLQVARALKRTGLIWGSNIGLLGLDGLEWVGLAGAGTTTPKQSTWQIGCATVEQVIRCIVGANDPVHKRALSGGLIVRGSTSRQRFFVMPIINQTSRPFL